ncbi:MAG: ATP-binding cassette domain-containing protein [Thermodesulfobacteriota bacterium]|nr:ATP-binding cassette domain-containing protein [Thermodesulfobacteriota bacterium]
MISANNVTLSFGKRVLFNNVNVKFLPGNCYGLIGANGAGKSTFLKVLSGEIEPTDGAIAVERKVRIAVLQQDQFAFDEHKVIDTVLMGHKKLYKVLMEREAIYSKSDFSEEDGIRAGELEGMLGDLKGWEAEAEAAIMLDGLGIAEDLHRKEMKELDGTEKVRVLLAQALFGNPDILLLDEPTNNLDLKSKAWLQGFLSRFNNTVIVVSHDRHFLNEACTHIVDIDFQKIQVYAGNYDFWLQASELALQQKRDSNKKKEDKVKELKAFVQRFSANASKSRQATARKKLIEKLTPDDIGISSRKPPYVVFHPGRECGDRILEVKNLTKEVDGRKVLDNFDLLVNRKDKIAFIGRDDLAKTALFQILSGELEADSGTYDWGVTITPAFFPKENAHYFNLDLNLVDWLRQYSEEKDERYIRGFLGRMLFSGDEATKKVSVLSGGERVRCMLARMMQSGANALVLEEPVGHLDLEAINALNQGLSNFPEVVLFATQDHQLIETVANRIVEFTPGGVIDRQMTFREYLESENVNAQREALTGRQTSVEASELRAAA